MFPNNWFGKKNEPDVTDTFLLEQDLILKTHNILLIGN